MFKSDTSKEAIAARGLLWTILGLSMLAAWSFAIHNWTVKRLAENIPCENADSQRKHCPGN